MIHQLPKVLLVLLDQLLKRLDPLGVELTGLLEHLQLRLYGRLVVFHLDLVVLHVSLERIYRCINLEFVSLHVMHELLLHGALVLTEGHVDKCRRVVLLLLKLLVHVAEASNLVLQL